METSKKNSSVIVIIILSILVVVLGGYIIYDKIINNNTNSNTEEKSDIENNTKEENENNNTEINNTKEEGECPLTKLDENYVLTEKDIDDIITSIESQNVIGFTRDKIVRSSIKKIYVSSSGYFGNVPFELIPNTSGTYASVTKVNGKFKVLIMGSGDLQDLVQRMEDTLISICK